MTLSIIAWVLLGLVAGVVANQLSGRRGAGLVSDAILGIAGAAVAGFAFDTLAGRGEGLGLISLLVSLLGAGAALGIFRMLVGPSKARDPRRTQPARRVRR